MRTLQVVHLDGQEEDVPLTPREVYTSLVVGEAFKMIGGKIMMIQAVMAQMPAKAWN